MPKLSPASRYAAQLEQENARLKLDLGEARARCAKLERTLGTRSNPRGLTIELDSVNDALRVQVPPAPGFTEGHGLNVGFEGAGFVLARILRAQAAASEIRDFKVGTIASPTQGMVQAWLRTNVPQRYTMDGCAKLDVTGAQL